MPVDQEGWDCSWGWDAPVIVSFGSNPCMVKKVYCGGFLATGCRGGEHQCRSDLLTYARAPFQRDRVCPVVLGHLVFGIYHFGFAVSASRHQELSASPDALGPLFGVSFAALESLTIAALRFPLLSGWFAGQLTAII